MKSTLFALALIFIAACSVDNDAGEWGPSIGARVSISAPDENGDLRTLGDLSGEKGLLLFMNRSADW